MCLIEIAWTSYEKYTSAKATSFKGKRFIVQITLLRIKLHPKLVKWNYELPSDFFEEKLPSDLSVRLRKIICKPVVLAIVFLFFYDSIVGIGGI